MKTLPRGDYSSRPEGPEQSLDGSSPEPSSPGRRGTGNVWLGPVTGTLLVTILSAREVEPAAVLRFCVLVRNLACCRAEVSHFEILFTISSVLKSVGGRRRRVAWTPE